MKSFAQYIMAILMICVAAGCQDDFMKDRTTLREGEATISVTLDFKPMSSALGRSRAAGDALKDVRSLHVLMYDNSTRTLIKSWPIEKRDWSVSDKKRNPADAENGIAAEAATKSISFKLDERIEFGEYYMFAVANIPDLLEKYSGAVNSIDGLKNLSLEWNSEDVGANGQMLGCLTNSESAMPTEEIPLIINENNTKLHAWLRRAASKVTVAYDGSNLNDGVSIYIKSVSLKNIPASCALGRDNKVENKDNLIATGDGIVYSTSSTYDASYPAVISNNLPFYPRKQEGDKWIKDPDSHSETNPNSLFFFENMQGKGADKRQFDNDNDGFLDELYPYAEKPCATYIEVMAHYESTNPEHPGISNITYRFMLGQDAVTDYNAKRNCHYKLTLHFNGFADDPDWRIDYVTRLGVTQPESVDYRGLFFEEDNVTSNQGNTFKPNVITVESYMYRNDSWFERVPVDYKIEYKDLGSNEFSETCPGWLDGLEKTDKGNGTHELIIKYKNEYTEQTINTLLSKNDEKTGVYDLSTKGGKEKVNTANCYIVDSKGTYKFPLVYGNAVTDGTEIDTSYKHQVWGEGPNYLKTFLNYKGQEITSGYILKDIYRDGNIPGGLTASLLWQDEKNLITNIQYDPSAYENGGIKFTVGDGIKEGNAVIVLKDPQNEVMWSWHIWVTAVDLSRKIILTNYHPELYTTQDFEIMPVNLGWCSEGKPVRYYERHECEVRFTQLDSGTGQEGFSQTITIIQEPHIALPCGNNPYFQWGRKDPFVASGNADYTNKTWYDAQNNSSSAGPKLMYEGSDDSRVKTSEAIAALIKNPDRWQNCPRESPGHWGNPYKPVDNIYFNLWDNSCWDGNDFVVKTIYDPCPAGYHVSSIYTFSGFTDYGGSVNGGEAVLAKSMYAATKENMMKEEIYSKNIFEFYTNKTKLISIGFPQNGYRDWDNEGKVTSYGIVGEIWCAQGTLWYPVGFGPYNAYHLEYSRYDHIYPSNNFYSTDGFAIRPTKTL